MSEGCFSGSSGRNHGSLIHLTQKRKGPMWIHLTQTRCHRSSPPEADCISLAARALVPGRFASAIRDMNNLLVGFGRGSMLGIDIPPVPQLIAGEGSERTATGRVFREFPPDQ